MISRENRVLDVIDIVLGWNLADEVFADAVNAQFGYMAGFCLD